MLQQENLSPAIRGGGPLVASTPSADSASEGAEKTAPVAEYNGKQYQTFDEALAVAKTRMAQSSNFLPTLRPPALTLTTISLLMAMGMP